MKSSCSLFLWGDRKEKTFLGFLDFFKKTDNKSDKLGVKPPQVRREVARFADTAANKRAQNYDRQEAIAGLADLAQPAENADELEKTEKGRAQLEEHEATRVEAAGALLRRFNFVMDPTITDQEEKQTAFEGIQAVGKGILEPLRAYAAKAESLSWPIKILRSALGDDEEAIVTELLSWLSKWDTEYAKFVDPKMPTAQRARRPHRRAHPRSHQRLLARRERDLAVSRRRRDARAK